MDLSIRDGLLRIDLSKFEKVLSVHGSFVIPLDQVEGISTEVPIRNWKDLRAPGIFVPWVIRAGSYLTGRGKEFWYVTRNKEFLSIELKQGGYNRIVLGIEDNEYWADQIRAAIHELLPLQPIPEYPSR